MSGIANQSEQGRSIVNKQTLLSISIALAGGAAVVGPGCVGKPAHITPDSTPTTVPLPTKVNPTAAPQVASSPFAESQLPTPSSTPIPEPAPTPTVNPETGVINQEMVKYPASGNNAFKLGGFNNQDVYQVSVNGEGLTDEDKDGYIDGAGLATRISRSGGSIQEALTRLIGSTAPADFWKKYDVLIAESEKGAWTMVARDKKTGGIRVYGESVDGVLKPYLSLSPLEASQEVLEEHRLAYKVLEPPEEWGVTKQELVQTEDGYYLVAGFFNNNGLMVGWYDAATDKYVKIGNIIAVNGEEAYNAQFEGMKLNDPESWNKDVTMANGEIMNMYDFYKEIANRPYENNPDWIEVDEQYHNFIQLLRVNYLRDVYTNQGIMTEDQINDKINELLNSEDPHALFLETAINTPDGPTISTPQEAREMLEGKQSLSKDRSDGLAFNNSWVSDNPVEAEKMYLTTRTTNVFGVEANVGYSKFEQIAANMAIVEYSPGIYGIIFFYTSEDGNHYLPTRAIFTEGEATTLGLIQDADNNFVLKEIDQTVNLEPLNDQQGHNFSLQALLQYNISEHTSAQTRSALDRFGLEVVMRVNEKANEPQPTSTP